MDQILRQLERQIAQGDPEAELRLITQLYRVGQLERLKDSLDPYLQFVGHHLEFDLRHNSTYYPSLGPVMNRLLRPYEDEIKQIGISLFGPQMFHMEKIYDQANPGPATWWVTHRNNMSRSQWLKWMSELEAAYLARGYQTHWDDTSLYVGIPQTYEELQQDAQDILDRYIPLMRMIRGVSSRCS